MAQPPPRTASTPSTTSTPLNTNPYKRVKLESNPPPSHLELSNKVIGTHSGTFQADEALGVWLLRQTPAYFRAGVIRTRNPAVLDSCDIVLDVGGVYDHEKLRYDHHQRGYDERFGNGDDHPNTITKLSASGLIYRHYGRTVISAFYPRLTPAQVEIVFGELYTQFCEAIDAIDTGVDVAPTGTVLYRDSTNLSSRIGRLNPRWNESNDDDDDNDDCPTPDERFEHASRVCGEECLSILTNIVESQLPARQFVEEALLARHSVDPSGEIICLTSGGLPWKKHLYNLERQHGISITHRDKNANANVPLIKYVLYTDQGGMWRIQCVSEENAGFTNRLGLPVEWRGVRDEDLSRVSGIEGCTFCHAAGFIGGNATFEGVLEMARVALAQPR